MTRHFAVAAALGAAALAFAADDPNAPLAQTKAQLQSLKKDEAAQKAGTQGGAKFDLPALNTPGQDVDLPAPRREDAEAKNERDGQKNWLLEGYDKLDKKADVKRADRKASISEKPLDPRDPNYFLRVYERQRAERDAAHLESNTPNASELKAAAVGDPFAPFMKGWLANSPVREALKDTLNLDASSESVAPIATTVSTPGAPLVGVTPSGEPQKPTTNPFVQALGLPVLDQPKTAEVRSPVAEMQTQPATSATSIPPSTTIYDLPERPKVDLKQALPPPPSEDKKYFPQLKKF